MARPDEHDTRKSVIEDQLIDDANERAKKPDPHSDWYWIRRNADGKMTAALVESAFMANPRELIEELQSMSHVGPIERVFTSRVVIGEAMKLNA